MIRVRYFLGVPMQTADYRFVPLVKFLERRAKPGTRIVLFGRGPEFDGLHSIAVSMLGDGDSIRRVEERAREITDDTSELDSQMRAAALDLGIEFVSNYEILCTDERCKYFTDAGSLMFWDRAHLTLEGAKGYGARVVERVVSNRARSSRRVSRDSDPRAMAAAASVTPGIQSAPDPSSGEAIAIVKGFRIVLRGMKLDGNTVVDTARLPFPKDRIRAASRSSESDPRR
jgi:hypothetical protein